MKRTPSRKHTILPRAALLLGALSLLVTGRGAAGAVILSNLGQSPPGSGGAWVFDYQGDIAAIEFQTDSSTWTLTEANLKFADPALGPNIPILVSVAADNSGAPGAILDSSQQDAPLTPGLVAFPLSGVTLSPNTSYWLEAQLNLPVSLGSSGPTWASLSPVSNATDPGSQWSVQGFDGSRDNGGTWFPFGRMAAFSLEASPVPEPSSTALVVAGMTMLLGFYRARQRA